VLDSGVTSVVSRHRYTFRDYLEVEEMSDVKHEFLGGEIYAMAGGTPEHAALAAALIGTLAAQLRGRPCRPYTSDLRVRIPATGLATYPDAAVICGELARDPESPTHVTNPTVVFEVLSAETEDYDRGEKREHYQQIDSLRAYVLISHRERRMEAWTRRAGEGWTSTQARAGERLTLEAIDVTLSVDDLYSAAGVMVD
jgi:Uma2 family endonuclease